MSENTTQKLDPNTLPEISYDDQMVDQARVFKMVKKGWMRGVVTKVERNFTKKGNLELTLRVAPLDENDTPERTTVNLKLYPPVKNPHVAGHAAPKTIRGCYFFARSVDDNFPRYARKGDGGSFIAPDGKVISKKEADSIQREVDSSIIKTSLQWWNNPDALKDEVLFIMVDHEQGQDGRTYAKVTRTRSDAPTGVELLTTDFTV